MLQAVAAAVAIAVTNIVVVATAMAVWAQSWCESVPVAIRVDSRCN